jgi:hypothetical protein
MISGSLVPRAKLGRCSWAVAAPFDADGGAAAAAAPTAADATAATSTPMLPNPPFGGSATAGLCANRRRWHFFEVKVRARRGCQSDLYVGVAAVARFDAREVGALTPPGAWFMKVRLPCLPWGALLPPPIARVFGALAQISFR